jgi:hypothetical protein
VGAERTLSRDLPLLPSSPSPFGDCLADPETGEAG